MNTTPKKLGKIKNEMPAYASEANYLVIAHGDVLKALEVSMGTLDWKAGEIKASVTDDEAEMVATVKIAGTDNWIGVVNSNTKRRRSLLYAGADVEGVPLCLSEGPPFWHDSRRDWKTTVEHSLLILQEEIRKTAKRLLALKQQEVTPVDADFLIMTALREGVISFSQIHQINRAREKWGKPHALSLYQAFSSVISAGKAITVTPKSHYLQRLLAFYTILQKVS